MELLEQAHRCSVATTLSTASPTEMTISDEETQSVVKEMYQALKVEKDQKSSEKGKLFQCVRLTALESCDCLTEDNVRRDLSWSHLRFFTEEKFKS